MNTLDAQLRSAANTIQEGGLVAFPTETVYGLGANALDETAVAKIFEAKGRPRFDPLIVHIRNFDAALSLLESPPEIARQLAEKFWPGPLTLVLKKSARVPDIVTAGNPTVAIRAPAHPMALALLDAADRPIAAPSANRFCSISPTTAAHVAEQLADAVDIILDGGPCAVGVESTIVSLVEEVPLLLRPGGLPKEELEAVLGPLATPAPEAMKTASPGRQSRHYAPRTKLLLQPANTPLELGPAGLLTLKPSAAADRYAAVEVLSKDGDLREAAANLFAAMRKLDALALAVIVAEPIPEVGLGAAIMDRLRRASAR